MVESIVAKLTLLCRITVDFENGNDKVSARNVLAAVYGDVFHEGNETNLKWDFEVSRHVFVVSWTHAFTR